MRMSDVSTCTSQNITRWNSQILLHKAIGHEYYIEKEDELILMWEFVYTTVVLIRIEVREDKQDMVNHSS